MACRAVSFVLIASLERAASSVWLHDRATTTYYWPSSASQALLTSTLLHRHRTAAELLHAVSLLIASAAL